MIRSQDVSVETVLTREDGAHGGEGVDLEGVHLPLGTEANRFHPHQQEAHGQQADVHELADDRQPEDAWKQKGGRRVRYRKRIRRRLIRCES